MRSYLVLISAFAVLPIEVYESYNSFLHDLQVTIYEIAITELTSFA